jgi:hypothetical protein
LDNGAPSAATPAENGRFTEDEIMTELIVDGTPAPAVPPVAVVPVPEAPKHQVQASTLPDDALIARIAAAKKTGQSELLSKLGLSSEEELASAIASHKAAQEAAKTEQQKAVERDVELQKTKAQLSEYQAAIEATWNSESVKLTTEQLAAVTEVAGDNPAARVRVLGVMRKTWAATPTAPTAAPTTTTTAAPVSTMPAGTAPAATGTTSPTDHKAEYDRLQKQNPIKAASYMQRHAREIFPE